LALLGSLAGVRKRLNYRYFNLVARGARNLSPVAGNPAAGVTLVTMLCHRDVLQYLLAVHSLCRYLRPARFVVVNDGSLTEADLALLHARIRPMEVLNGGDFLHPDLPRYSSWQRIQAVASLVADDYVVQMDADILFRGEIPEVCAAVAEQRPFMLGTDEGEQLVSAEAAIAFARQFYDEGERHVQCLCEINLDAFDNYREMRYVRACAGFSGFPRAAFGLQQLLEISATYSERLGADWPVWGSEQATSNILLANLPEVEVLPLSRYDSVERFAESLSMVHFIGSHRFDDGHYVRLARQYLRG
jgi:hypothetical protein